MTLDPSHLHYFEELSANKHKAIESTNFLADFQRHCLASVFAEKLIFAIKHFDTDLDTDHEVGMRLVSFGQTIPA